MNILIPKRQRYKGSVDVTGFKRTKLEDKKFEIDEIGLSVVLKVFDYFLESESISKVAWRLYNEGVTDENGKMLGLAYIRNLLSNVNYLGYVVAGGRLVKKSFREVISKETFDKAQKLLGNFTFDELCW